MKSRSSKKTTERPGRGYRPGFWWLVLTLSTAVLLMVAAWIARMAVERTVSSLVSDRLEATLNMDAASVAVWLDTHRMLSDWMAARIADVPDPQLSERLLQELAEIETSLDLTGIAVVSSETAEPIKVPHDLPLEVLQRFDAASQAGLQFAVNPETGDTYLVVETLLDRGNHETNAALTVVHPLRPVEDIIHGSGAGDGADSYLVSAEGRLLSPSRFESQLRDLGLLADDQPSLGMPVLDPGADVAASGPAGSRDRSDPTLAVRELVSGMDGVNIDGYRDYRGVEVVGAWEWLEDLGIGIVTEIDKSAAFAPVEILDRAFLHIITGIGIAAVIGYILALRIAGRFERHQTRSTVEELSHRLDSAEMHFDLVFEQAPVGMALLNERGEFVRTNAKLQQLLDLSEEEIPGRTLASVVAFGMDSGPADPLATPDQGRMAYPCRVKSAGNRLIPAILELTAVSTDEDSAPLQIATIQDVSDIRLARKMLGRLQERHEIALVAAGIGVFEVHVDKEEVVMYGTLCRLLGLDPVQTNVPIETFVEYFHPDDRERVADLWATDRHAPDVERFLECRLAGSGQIRDVQIRARAILSDGGSQDRLIGTVFDQTDQKQLHAELRESKMRAETANASKTRFLSNISHELRTPLNAVQGFAQLLRRGSALGSEQSRNVDQILAGAAKLSRLIDEVIEYAKMEGEGASVRLEVLKPEPFFEELGRVYGGRAKTKGLKWSLSISAGFPATIRVDREKFRRVITKLLDNAVKFTTTGEVALTVRFRDLKDKPWLVVDVRDTGPGIDPEDVKRVFRDFEQVGESGHGTGLGLGLSVASSLVRRMGGQITIDSKPGKGTRVRLELPIELTGSGKRDRRGLTDSQEMPVPRQSDWDLSELPSELVNELRESVQSGDLDRIVSLLDKVSTRQPKLADHLKSAVEDFDYGELTRILAEPSDS